MTPRDLLAATACALCCQGALGTLLLGGTWLTLRAIAVLGG